MKGIKPDIVSALKKWGGYSTYDTDCRWCLHFVGGKHGCELPTCCCEEEILAAIEQDKNIMRQRAAEWDG